MDNPAFKLRRSIVCPNSERVPSSEIANQNSLTFENCISACADSSECESVSYSVTLKCLPRKKSCSVDEETVDDSGAMTLDKYGLLSFAVVNKTSMQSSTMANYVASLAVDGKAKKTNVMLHGECAVTQKETVSIKYNSKHTQEN